MQHKKEKANYSLIGLMSGTSLDGLDLCYVNFTKKEEVWSYIIKQTKAVSYPEQLLSRLKNAVNLSGFELFLLDRELGFFLGKSINSFLEEFKISKDNIHAIASHGHTVFHQPEKGLTVQIGCGASIVRETGIKTINDFRKKDVLHGGQGAPLVPIGDKLLFSGQADAFLNIGGFSNFSVIGEDGSVTAYDICPVNIVINYFTRKLGREYDKNGEIASKTPIDKSLLEKLNALEIYKQQQPPSLSWEWVEKEILSILNDNLVSSETKISTATEHAAFQIASRLNDSKSKSVFITGGGAKNSYLIKRLKYHFKGEVVIPSQEIIDFKEALIFAFLGALYLENIPNCLPSATGAEKAVVGGVMHEA